MLSPTLRWKPTLILMAATTAECSYYCTLLIAPSLTHISHLHAQINLDFDGDEDSRVLLLVHDTKPPFLEGKVGF